MKLFDNLKDLRLHDQEVYRINIGFDSSEIQVGINIFKEELDDYKKICILFKDIYNVKFTELEFKSVSSLEISSFKFSEERNTLFIEFIFLLGFGLPSASLSFNFKEYELIENT